MAVAVASALMRKKKTPTSLEGWLLGEDLTKTSSQKKKNTNAVVQDNVSAKQARQRVQSFARLHQEIPDNVQYMSL